MRNHLEKHGKICVLKVGARLVLQGEQLTYIVTP